MPTTINGSSNVNLDFSTGGRITGDFSNATIANRVMFQTSTVNGASSIFVIPNGTSTTAAVNTVNNSDPTNASITQLQTSSSESIISANRTGTGSYLPMTFYTAGSERMRINQTTGAVTVSSPDGGLGYGTGAGGTVTQATSKSTTVTLNRPTGQITMNNALLGAGSSVAFIFNNSLISANDLVVLNVNWNGSTAYTARVYSTQAGSCSILVTNTSGSNLSDALTLNFAIIKGATA